MAGPANAFESVEEEGAVALGEGGGPPVIAPPSRRPVIKSRMATAMPMEVSSKRLPFGASATAPLATQRAARGTSAVMTMSAGPTA